MAGDFDESSHPRAADGKFGQGSGGGKQKASPSQDQKAKDQKAKPTARSKAAAAKAKVGERRKAARAKAQAVVAKAKLRAKAMVEKAKAMQPRGKAPTREAKAKVSAARSAAKANAKDIVSKAKERAAAIVAKHAPSSPAQKPDAKPTPAQKPAVQAPKASPATQAPAAAKPAQAESGAAKARTVSGEEHDKAASELHAKMTPTERSAVDLYISPAYRQINGDLRSGSVTEDRIKSAGASDEKLPMHHGDQIAQGHIDRSIAHLDRAIDKSVIDAPVTTYRGSQKHPELEKLQAGQTFTDKAYVSTATEPSKVLGRDYMFVVTSPAGTKLAPLSNGAEREMLLARGTQFRVDKREDTTRKNGYGETVPHVVFHVTVVGQGA
jgi:hypothetical protein